MDRINHKISLDFQQRGAVPKIYANQNEVESRAVDIALFNAGSKWAAPAGVTVVMSYIKPDGIGGEYDHLPDDSPAWAFSTDRSEVTVKLAPQMFTVAGEVHCKVRFVTTASNDPVQVLSTFRFDLVCDRDSVSGESEPYFSVKSFDEMYQAIDEAKADAAEALAAGIHDITAEYVAAKTSRPTLTPDVFLLEQEDGLYRINDEDGDVPFTARVVTDRAGAVSMDVVEYRQGDRIQRTYIDSTLITTVTMSSGDGAVTINPETLLGDLATAQSNIAALQAENVALKTRVDAQGYELENLIVAGDGKIYTKSVDSSEAYTKIVPANALPYAALDSIGGKSVVQNQLVMLSGADTQSGIAITRGQFSVTAKGTSTVTGYQTALLTQEKTQFHAGHKYIFRLSNVVTSTPIYVRWGGSAADRAPYTSDADLIVRPTSDWLGTPIAFQLTTGDIVDIALDINVVDLTKMFGAGREPQTVEQAYAMGVPQNYIPYNAGEIVSADVQSINASGQSPKPIPQAIRNLPGYGWSAGSAYNVVDYAHKQYVQKISREDMGLMGWNRAGADQSIGLYTYAITGKALGISNILTSAYQNTTVTSWDTNKPDLSICGSASSRTIVIRDTSVANAAELKAKLSGVYLYFEVEAPIITDISAIIPANFEVLPVEGGGTVTFQQANGTTLAVPSTITFPVKIGGNEA